MLRSQEGQVGAVLSRKLRRKHHPPLFPEDRSFQNTSIDPVDYWRRSGYHWPRDDFSQNSVDTNSAVSRLYRIGTWIDVETPDTSFTEESGKLATKRPKNGR